MNTQQDVPALEIFAGKKVVVVGVPGALTPTCSETHVPGTQYFRVDRVEKEVREYIYMYVFLFCA